MARHKRRSDSVRRRAPKKALNVAAAQRDSQQDAVLRQFIAGGEIGPACQHAGVHRDTHYDWLKRYPKYAKQFADAQVMRVEVLEQEIRRRALVGWDEPVFYKGQKIADVRKFSDVLLIFAAKGEKPEKYRERYEHTGKNGGPIQTEDVALTAKASLLEKINRLAERVDKSADLQHGTAASPRRTGRS